ncbi:hypothetical protein BSK59_13735 [Paenibacillus odorifer]|uniref:hypothetical protein n=1 Tax=Paenibacillus odorifer TaxID=189426 RepID=UPI00096F9487|nr:hypothetical protein [Paenibacillus odorifer]OME55532.1 hypothetical protein BSK59_13735 [Paenibacillus odorifer]
MKFFKSKKREETDNSKRTESIEVTEDLENLSSEIELVKAFNDLLDLKFCLLDVNVANTKFISIDVIKGREVSLDFIVKAEKYHLHIKDHAYHIRETIHTFRELSIQFKDKQRIVLLSSSSRPDSYSDAIDIITTKINYAYNTYRVVSSNTYLSYALKDLYLLIEIASKVKKERDDDYNRYLIAKELSDKEIFKKGEFLIRESL